MVAEYKVEGFTRRDLTRGAVVMYHIRRILSFIIHDAMLAAVGRWRYTYVEAPTDVQQ